ncbi:conserved unknown protein [Ectocarpus siliculosus]|uniref:WSC domain-containing protein n=1 Tax=Ectocarpus siliculosus TaxID=2880 RepID=D7G957_ECTSI|nr:conserved unknown protein [Ectocarpus siliculosus]|eukprot:CBJ28221.1 conserved unknown protein [Ectocarpus siliculosus]
MMRSFACLAALVATQVASHPLCFIDDKPTDYDQVLTFCDNSIASSGACCTDDEEAQVVVDFNAVTPVGEELTGDCPDLYKQVVCARCHSYSAHLYEYLGAELGMLDAEIFEPGLNEVFPDLADDQQPGDTVSMRQTPDGSQWWLLGISGQIYAVDSDSMDESELVIDVSGPVPSGGNFYDDFEEGLLDVAFGPMFGDNSYPQYFYVSYTVLLDDGEMQRNRLAKFTYFPEDPVATRASEEVLLTTVPKYNSIHSAGWLGFKPSDYGNPGYSDLYWTTGDGGPQTDPFNHSQDETTMLGAMMRISVPADGTGYTIPSGNYPGAKAEVCAIGLRNPWRCGFDRLNDDLYCGDVGHTLVEEINFIENIYFLREEEDGWAVGTIISDASVQIVSFAEDVNGEIMLLDYQHNMYHMPCGDLCATTCLDQAEDQPTYESLGCYADDVNDRALPIQGPNCGEGETAMSPAICASYCETLGSTFFGVQFSFQCFCGPSTADYDKHGSLSSDNCEYLCDANPDFFCGGFSTIEVFTIGDPTPTEAPAPTPLVNPSTQAPGTQAPASTAGPVLVGPSTAPTTPAPVNAGAAGYLGCFGDSQTDRVFSVVVFSGSMTTAICASTCADYAYYGTQFGGECWCGNNADYDVYGEATCDMGCTGDSSDICGGFNAMSFYSTGSVVETPSPVPDEVTPSPVPDEETPSPVPDEVTPSPVVPTEPGYLGCFGDSQADRVFSVVTGSGSMTTAICASTCADYAYYGTQFGGECWCGNNAAYDVYGEATCDMGCTGDSSEKCGGFNAMSVYGTA